MGNGWARELVFNLASFRLKDDASIWPPALPQSSLQEICGLYCTQEQNTSLSFYQKGFAYSHQAEIQPNSDNAPESLYLGRENEILIGKRLRILLCWLSPVTVVLQKSSHRPLCINKNFILLVFLWVSEVMLVIWVRCGFFIWVQNVFVVSWQVFWGLALMVAMAQMSWLCSTWLLIFW